MYKFVIIFVMLLTLVSCATVNYKNVAVEKAKDFILNQNKEKDKTFLEEIKSAEITISQSQVVGQDNNLDIPSKSIVQSCISFKIKNKKTLVFGVGELDLKDWEPIQILTE